MISVDTNIVIRLLTKDDPDQYEKALLLFENEYILIPLTVILETEWVLRFAYKFSSKKINKALKLLLGLPNVETDNNSNIAQALNWHEHGMDFADALHLACSENTDKFFTFDKKLISKAVKLSDIPVGKP